MPVREIQFRFTQDDVQLINYEEEFQWPLGAVFTALGSNCEQTFSVLECRVDIRVLRVYLKYATRKLESNATET